MIRDNKLLSSLKLNHNKILEDQPKPTAEMLENGTWELTDRNRDTMLCFKDFIKYNINLVSIQLENTGLIVPAMWLISSWLNKS